MQDMLQRKSNRWNLYSIEYLYYTLFHITQASVITALCVVKFAGGGDGLQILRVATNITKT